ncbi:MAG: hypothetical protein ACI9JM_002768 [Halioglobus sp.]|jgi:hypothetical protein
MGGVKPDGRAGYLIGAVVLLICVLVYGVALNGPLFFDDIPNLVENDLARVSGSSFDDWRRASISSTSGYLHRPITMFTFAANYVAAGDFTSFSLKTTNLGIHLLLGALCYWFTLLLLTAPVIAARSNPGQRAMVALIAASIWLLHPIHVSTVLYAVQRMAQLSTVFTVAGLILFLRYRLRWAEVGATAGELMAAALWLGILGFIAVLSKENGALLPWLIAVIEVTLFGGAWAGRERRDLRSLGWLLLILPLLAVLLLYVFLPETLIGRYGSREFSPEERLLTQGRVLWQYLSWLLVPNILDMGFFHDDIPLSRSFWMPLTTGLSLFAWLAVLIAGVLLRQRFPLFAFALLFYLVAHSMESSILPLEMVFEHRNYLPSVGVFIFVGAGLVWLANRVAWLQAGPALVIIVVLLASLLWVRTDAWSDELKLARFNVVNHPQSPRANFFYANAQFKRFQSSRELGLSDDEVRALVVTARIYYERMHAFDERDFAALVMLYQLDALRFPVLAEQNNWLSVMEELSKTRRLQPSDRAALGALVGVAMSPVGKEDAGRIAVMLEGLLEKNPQRMDLLSQYYRLLDNQEVGGERLQNALERSNSLNPNNRKAAAYLAQYYGNQDLARTYEAVREWLRRDVKRKEIAVIRAIFED